MAACTSRATPRAKPDKQAGNPRNQQAPVCTGQCGRTEEAREGACEEEPGDKPGRKGPILGRGHQQIGEDAANPGDFAVPEQRERRRQADERAADEGGDRGKALPWVCGLSANLEPKNTRARPAAPIRCTRTAVDSSIRAALNPGTALEHLLSNLRLGYAAARGARLARATHCHQLSSRGRW